MTKHLIGIILIFLMQTNDAYAKARGTIKVDGIFSKTLNEQRDLLIKLPNSYFLNTKLNYPVLYLTDGLRNFNHVSGTLDLLNQDFDAEEMIIVAIKNTHRTRDFTPTYDESYNEWGISGGADKFLDFIQSELKPYVNKKYRTNHFDVLSGHSLGGLLSIYALQTRPDLFQAFFAFSPSLWWHEQMIFDSTTNFFTQQKELNKYLYLNLANEKGHMLSSFKKYQDLLVDNSLKGFSYHAELIEHETHNTSAMVGHNTALIKLFTMLQCSSEDIYKGLTAIKKCFKDLSRKYGAEISPSYNVVRHATWSAQKNKPQHEAIKAAQLAIKEFPHISDAYFRHAYALKAAGKVSEALELVNKALEQSTVENVENNKFKTFKVNLLSELAKSAN